jgi:hypothetical protein
MTRKSSIVFAALFLIAGGIFYAQTAEKAEPQVIIEDIAITVSPEKPIGPEGISLGTLCNLKVKLRNRGTQKAYSFGFGVKINGREVATYDNMLYIQTVDSGASGEIVLSNFYSTEPGGPRPADGKVTIEVTLKKAQWVEIKKEGNAQVWTPLGEVKGLPISKSVSKPLQGSA